MDKRFMSPDLPGSDEMGGSPTGSTAVADRPNVPAHQTEAPGDFSAERPTAHDDNKIPAGKPATAALGGSFASVIFHLWLLAMLASLTLDQNHQLPATAFDAV